jgi:hypothetical protein
MGDALWLRELSASHERVQMMSTVDATTLSSLADLEAFGALNLEPMPIDPVQHLHAGYAKEALPDEAPRRYLEASRRFIGQVSRLVDAPPTADFGFYRNAGRQFTVAEMIEDVLSAEAQVQRERKLTAVPSEID